MLARRLLILLALLMGLTALAAGVAPRYSGDGDGDAQVPVAADPRPTPQPVEQELDAEAAGQRVRARVGQNVVITISGDVLDTVSLAEVGNRSVDPDSPARFELLAETPGRYSIDLLESGRQIGVLEIRPAAR